jgi:anti-sigma regulatory factor (Ser/Thr protein kinase)
MDREPTATVRYILDGRPECVAEARRHLRAFLGTVRPPFDERTADYAELATSELISNAVQHAPGPCALRLSADGRYLRIEVDDHSPQPPVERDIDLSDGHGGAGLRLLRAVSEKIEVRVHRLGKTVAVTLSRD